MPDPYVVKPDSEFLHAVLAEGGEDLKKCYQCATCSVVCELSEGKSPFPRKEMIWAQWGLKDRLVADPDVWLCHQCNDCTTRCPRGARPGDVLAAVRHKTVEHYAVPRVMAVWTNKLSGLPLMSAVPIVLLGLALAVRGPIENLLSWGVPHGESHGYYADFFPHWLLIAFFTAFTGLAFLSAMVGVVRFWTAMKAGDDTPGGASPPVGIVPAVINTLKAIFLHERFGKCAAQASRKTAHLLSFYGFMALLIATAWAVFDLYLFPLIGIAATYPFGLAHPIKIVANIGCVALIVGCVMAIRNRQTNKEESGASSSFDLMFVWLLLSVGVSGLATEILRFTGEAADVGALTFVAFAIYFVHLVLVFELLVYLPFSKFAHVMYRAVAMVYAEHTGRGQAAKETS
jgi:quinone-modifying oxidoreductase subunit QmoC